MMRVNTPGWTVPGDQQRLTLGLSASDPRLGIPEAALQDAIIDMATVLGWEHFHPHDSRRSREGWPDLVLWHPDRQRTLFVELKSQKGRVTDTQARCLTSLYRAGNDVLVWRPSDWINGTIDNELRI